MFRSCEQVAVVAVNGLETRGGGTREMEGIGRPQEHYGRNRSDAITGLSHEGWGHVVPNPNTAGFVGQELGEDALGLGGRQTALADVAVNGCMELQTTMIATTQP